MLAFLIGDRANGDGVAQRAGVSLGLFAGIPISAWRDGSRMAWQMCRAAELPARRQRQRQATTVSRNPALLPGGIAVQVHGWIDNCAELAAELGCPPGDQALVYGHAVRAWGDAAEGRVLGGYCAVFHDPQSGCLRLARSALYGPPLYYMVDRGGVAAASVPRVLEAIGLPRELNRQRIADSLFFNYSDDESYLKGCFKVPLGAVAEVATPGQRKIRRYFDPQQVPRQPKASAQDYVAEADRLLDEACRRYGATARNPGVLLTGGLDSSNMAARILRHWPAGRKLPSFTFVPLPDHGQAEIPGGLVDEGPAVRAFAAMHPAIEPHFVDNRGIAHDHRLEEMFLATGTGTPNLGAFYRYHGLFAAAREAGRDMLFSSDFGSMTFSTSGTWGYAEYLRRGKIGALFEALRGARQNPGSLPWRFLALAVAPNLPAPLWRLAMRLRGRHVAADNIAISALRPEAIAGYDVEQRAARAGTLYDRPLYGWRKDLIADNFLRGDVEGADMIQGWEQLYEVSMRDPTSYRPLVEFCLGLPTEMFLRDGQTRWLAREMGRGLMPEAQRTMPGTGQQNSDWHLRLTPIRDAMRRDVEAIRGDSVLGAMIDTDALLDSIDNWPATQSMLDEAYVPHGFRLPRAITMGRYVRFMTGQNSE